MAKTIAAIIITTAYLNFGDFVRAEKVRCPVAGSIPNAASECLLPADVAMLTFFAKI